MKKSSLTKKIKESAKNLSFSHIGFAKAKEYKEDNNHLNSWINNGYHADMHWIKNRLSERSNI